MGYAARGNRENLRELSLEVTSWPRVLNCGGNSRDGSAHLRHRVCRKRPLRYRAELIEITLAVWSPPPFSIDASTNRRNHHRLLMMSHDSPNPTASQENLSLPGRTGPVNNFLQKAAGIPRSIRTLTRRPLRDRLVRQSIHVLCHQDGRHDDSCGFGARRISRRGH